MRPNKTAAMLMVAATLAGCAGQPSPGTYQALMNARQACAAGDQNACAALPEIEHGAAVEAQMDAQNRTDAAVGLGLLAILGAAVGVAAANNGGGYYHGGYHHHYRHWH